MDESSTDESLAGASASDFDADGLNGFAEEDDDTHPFYRDTDGDGLVDGDEVNRFDLSPTNGETTPNLADAEVVDSRLGSDCAGLVTTHSSCVFSETDTALLWPATANSSPYYTLTTTHEGFHLLAVDVRNQSCDLPEGYSFRFETLVNEMNCGSLRAYGADFDRVGTGYVITPWLKPGTYAFRIRWNNESVSAYRRARPALEGVRLLWVNGPDSDEDGMQDWMKKYAANMPIDRDGDGICDGQEILRYNTNPLNADTDGDGLDDRTEIRIGTSPTNPDTDADGATDGEERLDMGTDPLLPDFNANWTNAVELSASSSFDRVGTWSGGEDGSLASIRRGSLGFTLVPPSPGNYFVRIDASHYWHSTNPSLAPVTRSRFVVYMDDEIIGTAFLDHIPGYEGGFVRVPLPYVTGPVTVRIVWDSVTPGLGVDIASVALETPQGPDDDGDGRQDWAVAKSFRDDVVTSSVTTCFSPLCLEGVAAHPPRVSVSSGEDVYAASALSSSNWYADVALLEGENRLSVSFEDGLRTSAVRVNWAPIDIGAETSELYARLGDELLYASSSAADVTIFANGKTIGSRSLAAGEADHVVLDAAGEWLFTLRRADGTSFTRAVVVIGGGLPAAEPAEILGRTRTWGCPDVDDMAYVSVDPDMTCTRIYGTNLILRTSSMFKPHFVAVRAFAGGPVIDSRRVRPFWIRNTVDTFVHAEDLGDDYEVWADDALTMEIPSDVTVVGSVALGGVTLDSYRTSMSFPGSQIPSASHCKLRIRRPDNQKTSICHKFEAFQNGHRLGGSYHNNGTMPGDMK